MSMRLFVDSFNCIARAYLSLLSEASNQTVSRHADTPRHKFQSNVSWCCPVFVGTFGSSYANDGHLAYQKIYKPTMGADNYVPVSIILILHLAIAKKKKTRPTCDRIFVVSAAATQASLLHGELRIPYLVDRPYSNVHYMQSAPSGLFAEPAERLLN
jgi:hypothetical protein